MVAEQSVFSYLALTAVVTGSNLAGLISVFDCPVWVVGNVCNYYVDNNNNIKIFSVKFYKACSDT